MNSPASSPFPILGVDTSSHAGSLALLHGNTLLEERSLAATGRRHARTLVAEVQALLQAHNVAPRDIGLLAVSAGPGSFTGLRVGVVFAKTFGYLTGTPLVAVDTFAIIAANAPADVTRLWVLEDAQRGALFAGHYNRTPDGHFTATGTTRIVPLEELAPLIEPADAVIGPGVKRLPDDLRTARRCLEGDLAHPRGEHVARIGLRQWATGDRVTPFEFVPHYIRRSAAEEVAEKKALEATR